MSDRITQATATAGYGVSESASKVLTQHLHVALTDFVFQRGNDRISRLIAGAANALAAVTRRDDRSSVCPAGDA